MAFFYMFRMSCHSLDFDAVFFKTFSLTDRDMFRDDIMESKLEAVMALAALLQVQLDGITQLSYSLVDTAVNIVTGYHLLK